MKTKALISCAFSHIQNKAGFLMTRFIFSRQRTMKMLMSSADTKLLYVFVVRISKTL